MTQSEPSQEQIANLEWAIQRRACGSIFFFLFLFLFFFLLTTVMLQSFVGRLSVFCKHEATSHESAVGP